MYLIRALNVFKVWYCLEILLCEFKQISIKLINLKRIKVLFNVKAN